MIRSLLRTPNLGRLAAALAVALGAAGAVALPAGADVSIQSPPVAAIQIGSPAVLGARGAVVTVPLTIVCVPGSRFNSINLEVTQVVGGGDIARGFASTNPPACTGNFQTVNVLVVSSTVAFRARIAFATASLVSCDAIDCRFGSDQREIRVVR